MSRPITPDLPTILRLVATLGTAPRMGREWRKAALKLADHARTTNLEQWLTQNDPEKEGT